MKQAYHIRALLVTLLLSAVSCSDVIDEASRISSAARGELDPTFNAAGYYTHHNAAGGNGDDVGLAVSLQADGRIIITGLSAPAPSNHSLVMWRLMPDGSPDQSFGTQGVLTSGGSGFMGAIPNAVTVSVNQPDNKVVTAQTVPNARGGSDLMVRRFGPDNAPDPHFGADGAFTWSNTATTVNRDIPHAMQIQPDGKIIIVGMTHNGINFDMAVWRLR